jgi:hypothetical protein
MLQFIFTSLSLSLSLSLSHTNTLFFSPFHIHRKVSERGKKYIY